MKEEHNRVFHADVNVQTEITTSGRFETTIFVAVRPQGRYPSSRATGHFPSASPAEFVFTLFTKVDENQRLTAAIFRSSTNFTIVSSKHVVASKNSLKTKLSAGADVSSKSKRARRGDTNCSETVETAIDANPCSFLLADELMETCCDSGISFDIDLLEWLDNMRLS